MGDAILSYRDLRVWKLGMDLVEEVYKATASWPNHERYALIAQVHRAAISVPSNIAEGHTSSYRREFVRHLGIAQRSLAELETQLEIAWRLGYLDEAAWRNLVEATGALGRQINALRNSIRKRESSQ